MIKWTKSSTLFPYYQALFMRNFLYTFHTYKNGAIFPNQVHFELLSFSFRSFFFSFFPSFSLYGYVQCSRVCISPLISLVSLLFSCNNQEKRENCNGNTYPMTQAPPVTKAITGFDPVLSFGKYKSSLHYVIFDHSF